MALLIAFVFFATVLPWFRPYGWVDDWIYSRPLQFTSASEWISWLFAQHVDHRIPLQKASNFLLLRATDFDYRSLVAVNFALAVATTMMLANIARRHRGRAAIGDIAFPFVILNFAMGYTHWAFQFQFISSMFAFTGFLYVAFMGAQNGSTRLMGWGGVILCICTLLGMNGTLIAIGAAVSVIVWSWMPVGKRGVFLAPYYAALAMGAVILATWTPYAKGHAGVLATLDYATSLMTGAFVVFIKDRERLMQFAVGACVLAAAVVVVHSLVRRRVRDADLLLGASLGIFFCLMVGIAYGRTDLQGRWNEGAAMHYGVLAIYFPIISWIILSAVLPRRVAGVFGVLLLATAVASFAANHQWRSWMKYHLFPLQEKALQDLQSDKPVEQIVKENLTQFLPDDPPAIPQAVDGINGFRQAGAILYGPRR